MSGSKSKYTEWKSAKLLADSFGCRIQRGFCLGIRVTFPDRTMARFGGDLKDAVATMKLGMKLRGLGGPKQG